MYRDLNLDIKYVSSETNVLESFYIPVLKNSKQYDRAVGYFSSNILKEYVSSLKYFYKNGGKIRLVISPWLSKEDIEVLEKTQYIEDGIREIAEKSLLGLFEDNNTKSTDIFFNLIISGILEVKIAVSKNPLGMFHEKIGLFYSMNNEVVAIMGSNNETLNAVSANQESFDVYKSWIQGQGDYIIRHQQDFEKYWRGDSKGLFIYSLDEASHNRVFQKVEKGTLDKLYEELEIEESIKIEADLIGLKFTPYDYQKLAVEKLMISKKGIFKFATGSGKTKTAIYFMNLMKKKRSKNLFIIVVPDKTLVGQWFSEVREYFPFTITAYSESPNWRKDFRRYKDTHLNTNISVSQQVVITTIDTMFKDGQDGDFLKTMSKLDDFIFIGDECHNLVTERIINNLPSPTWRLGLSATPESYAYSEISNKMMTYFGGIIAEYSLGDAIRDDKLVPYNYYPIFVELNEEEKEEYSRLSKDIAKLQSMIKEKFDFELKKRLEMISFKRARLVYGAVNKLHKLKEILLNKLIEMDYLLVYCGAASYQIPKIDNEENNSEPNDENNEVTLTQLNLVNELLKKLDIPAVQYTQSESEEQRKINFDLFRSNTVSTLVAIKCLDEGVNIPEIRNAIILASSGNIREFVQRRGRILRKSRGKEIANIYDFVVRDFENHESSLNLRETSRIIEYAKDAINATQVLEDSKLYIDIVEEKKNERQ